MNAFDAGTGHPIVVVPGITARWEWIEPALQALATRTRTIGYSLCGETGSGFPFANDAGFDVHVEQLAALFDAKGLNGAAVCGISFGGWIALRFAARWPARVSALVLASAPGPRFEPNARQQRFLHSPRLAAPLFVATAPGRLMPEIRAALPDPARRVRFRAGQLWRIVRAPASPRRMARRIRAAARESFGDDCARVNAPTLVLTGEAALDRVVPVGSSRKYLAAIPGATHRVLERTGHIGVATRPREWAAIVGEFVRENG